MRAPDIYHHIMDNYSDKLVRLGDVATVRRGITTGVNEFFILTPERIVEFGIEPEFCLPVMTSPQESRSIAVDPDTLPKRLFMCHKDKNALAGTGALTYVLWGEAQGYHRRTSMKSRRRWYDLGERDMQQLAISYLIDTTAHTFFTGTALHFGDNFQELRRDPGSSLQLCAVLNSTMSQLMFNISGRANFDGGLTKIQTFEIESLQIVNPQLLSEPDPAIFDSVNWDVLAPSVERWQIDGMVFDALGLTAGERVAVYEGVLELVGNRTRWAGSVSGRSEDAISQSIVTRGKSIYEERIRHKVEAAERGRFAVIDVFSEDYEIDPSHSAATRRLVSRHPGAVTYTVRIGHPATYKTGLRSLLPTS